MSFKVYDADQVTVIICGVPMVGGYADGEFLRLESDSDLFSDVAGTDGEVTRSKTNDGRATATLILMQSSDSNDLLSTIANNDKNKPNGAGVGEFLVRDNSGRAIYKAPSCWIKKEPQPSFGREATSREWVIRIPKLTRVDGGNITIE